MQEEVPAGHPSDEDLERFLAVRLAPVDQQRVVRHLLAGCCICSRKLVGQAPENLLARAAEKRERSAINRGSILDKTIAEALKQDARWRTDDKKFARSLELLRQSSGAFDDLSSQQVGGLQRYSDVEMLLDRIAELRFQDPKTLKRIAFSTVNAAENLEEREHNPLLIFDLRARAWAELANAFRINEEFDEAAGAFNCARTLLRRGSGDPGAWAKVADFEASLLRNQRRMIEAAELTDTIYKIYTNQRDSHLQGRTLISKASILRYQGHLRPAILLLRKSLPLIERDREPQLVLVLQQSFIGTLLDGGQYREAERLLLKSGLRRSLSAFPLALLKLRWLEGKLLAHLKKDSAAERALLETRSAFLAMSLDYDAALSGLDLLSLWNRQGKSTTVRKTAREIYGVLRDLGIPQEAAKAKRYLE